MTRYDTDYQAFRRDWLHKLRQMDPDVIVAELQLDTDEIIDKFWETVELYIEENYDGSEEDDQEDKS